MASTNLNQWKNTYSVIKWHKNISNKSSHSFICFDIIDFYPSITEDLLTKALVFASEDDEITDQEKKNHHPNKNITTFQWKWTVV